MTSIYHNSIWEYTARGEVFRYKLYRVKEEWYYECLFGDHYKSNTDLEGWLKSQGNEFRCVQTVEETIENDPEYEELFV